MPQPDAEGPINEVADPRRERCEILDLQAREVWQDLNPTPRSWWDDLALEAPLMKLGYGSGNMDRMWFRRSPGADEDGPVRTREIAGRRFFYCAKPPASMPEGEPRRLMIDKHQTLLYEAGRRVRILATDGGKRFVLVVEGIPGAPEPKLPEGWRLYDVEIEEDWPVELPAPTETWWFEGMVSYQGPIDHLPGDA